MLSRVGFLVLVAALPGMLLAVAALDLSLTIKRRHPVGYYLNEFMIAYPWFAAVLAVIFGAMIAHFFLHITNG
jgi:hypothetical protein